MGVKLRDDLVGVVYLNGRAYSAGDEVPDDVRVGGHLTEDGKDYGHLTPEPPRAVVEGSQIPLTEVEVAAAEAIGLDLVGHEPEWLRGAVAGHQLAGESLSGEPLTADETAAAEALGLPTDVHTERIRGAIEGHAQGVADGHLTPEPPRAVVEGSQIPLTEVEVAAAEAIGLDLVGHEPEWLRGAVAGHQLAGESLSGEPLTADETAAAEALGLPTDVHTERIRGAIEGHAQGVADTLANAAKGTGFDPSDAPNADAVHEYVAAHPDETAAVLALEAAGKARKGILGEYLG